jgi:hypothetical protein
VRGGGVGKLFMNSEMEMRPEHGSCKSASQRHLTVFLEGFSP